MFFFSYYYYFIIQRATLVCNALLQLIIYTYIHICIYSYIVYMYIYSIYVYIFIYIHHSHHWAIDSIDFMYNVHVLEIQCGHQVSLQPSKILCKLQRTKADDQLSLFLLFP